MKRVNDSKNNKEDISSRNDVEKNLAKENISSRNRVEKRLVKEGASKEDYDKLDELSLKEKSAKKMQAVFAVIIGVAVVAIMTVCLVLSLNGFTGLVGTGSDSPSNTISVAGTHELSGSYKCITVDAINDVKLILNNATITCENGPAIYIAKAGDVEIVLNGENVLSATTNDDIEGVIHSKEDLVLSGDGVLTLEGNLDGIVSKDNLTINGGVYNITTGDDAVKGKDSVEINGGVFNLTSTGGDAIKATNEEDTSLGFVKISGGDFSIDVANDGFQAVTDIVIDDGVFEVNCGDDAFHADGKLEINGGKFDIDAHEGLEATYILINGGEISIVASDDGMNAGSKSDLYAVMIEINGGEIKVDMGMGDTDAIDSNGDLKITGGTIDITAQSPFDYEGKLTFTGGTVIINGVTTDIITNQMMGGGMPGGMNGAGGVNGGMNGAEGMPEDMRGEMPGGMDGEMPEDMRGEMPKGMRGPMNMYETVQ